MIKAACPLTCDNCLDPIVPDYDAGVDDDYSKQLPTK